MAKSAKKSSLSALPFAFSYLLIIACSGCIPRTIHPQSTTVAPAADPMDWSDWALTLGHSVEGNLVKYSNLLRDHAALDRFLALLAVSGPRLTPEPFTSNDAQLAFYANAHNAAVVAGVLALSSEIQVPAKLPVGFEQSTAIRVDG